MTESNVDEVALMMQVKDGQLSALAPLFEANKTALYNFFRRMGNSPEVSEDLVQETFMRILAYRSSFNGDSKFRTWLFGVARNVSVDHYRKHGHAQHDEYEDDHLTEDTETLQEQMMTQQKHSLFEQALLNIPAELREILVLSRFQQMKYEDIAEMINCNLNTLKSRMSLAITKLKSSYQQLTGEECQ